MFLVFHFIEILFRGSKKFRHLLFEKEWKPEQNNRCFIIQVWKQIKFLMKEYYARLVIQQ